MADEHLYTGRKTVAFVVVILLAFLAFLIAKPFILTIVGSMVLAYITRPLYVWLKRVLKSPTLTAAIISGIIVFTMAIAVWFLVPEIVRQTFTVYTTLQKVDFAAPLKILAPKFFTSPEFTVDFTVTVNQVISKGASSILNRFEGIIMNLPMMFVQFIVMLFIFFFSLRDSEIVVDFLKGLSPLNESSEKRFIQKFNDITKSIVYGLFIIGFLQGIFAGIGLFAFKVPQSLFLSIVAIFFGIIPYVGTWAVWVPVGIGMFVSGNTQIAAAFAVYQLVAAGLIEFFVRPYIIQKQAKILMPTVIIGMLGGAYAFGVIGLVIGPLIIEYLLLFLEFYRKKSLHELFE
ncbi:MAG: AI-2E family transporter [archaeon]